MKSLTRKIAMLLVFVFVLTSVGEVSGGITARAAGNEGYTVTFIKENGTKIPVSVSVDEKFLSSIPSLETTTGTKTYYWKDTSSGTQYTQVDLANLEIKRNYTFQEVYKEVKRHQVSFTYNGTSIANFPDIIEGDKVTGFGFSAPNGGPANSRFVGWGENILYPNYNARFGSSLNSGYGIYRDWNCIPLFVYDITFKKANGSRSVYSVEAGKEFSYTVDHGEYYDEQTSNADQDASIGNECTFTGWYTAGDNLVSATDEIRKTFTEHTTLEARWSKPKGEYKVTFAVAGLSGATKDIVIDNVAKDAVILSFPTVSKKGHELTGWNTKKDGSGEEFFKKGAGATQIKDDVTLYPIFQKNKYNVEFNYHTEEKNISKDDRETTELSLIYPMAEAKKVVIEYDEKIPGKEKPTDVAKTMVQKYIAPDAKNMENNIEYTVTCEYTGDWKVAKTSKVWDFAEDRVSSHMIKEEKKDGSLHPVYKISYKPYDPPEGYQYDEDTIFDLPSHTVTFSYTNTSKKATTKNKKVAYGRRVPTSAIPTDVQNRYQVEFRDRASLDSDEYISYTATYTYSKSWVKLNTMAFWNFNSDLVTEDVTLVPHYTVKFDPYAPPYDGEGGGGGGTDEDKDSVDKLKDRYVEITFDHNNGSGLTTVMSVPKGRAIDPNVAPTVKKDGKKFIGWSKIKDDSVLYNWSEIVDNKLTLYAVWKEQVDVVYNSEGGDYISVETIEIGQKAPKPADPVKENFEFLGWSKTRQQGHASSDYTKYAYDFTKPVTEDDTSLGMMNLYAWYKGNTKVQFYYNRTSSDHEYWEEDVRGADKKTPVFPKYEPDVAHCPKNMIFTGWYSSREGGNLVTAKNFQLEEGNTLKVYAHWAEGFKVTYVIENGNRKTVFYKNGEIAEGLEVEQKNGKMVTGWYLDSGCVEEVNWGGISSDTVVYAEWGPIPMGGEVTITFDSNDGEFKDNSKQKTRKVAKGSKISESNWPETPTYPGDANLIFGGWCLDKEGTKDVNSKTYLPVKNITFYAKWVYEVQFDLGGKATIEGLPNQYICKNQYVTEPQNVKSKQYLLSGWTTDPKKVSEEDLWDFSKDKVTGPITLYAVWGAPVSYDCNGGYFEGNVSLEAKVDANHHVIKIDEEPVYPGKEFAGWYQDEFCTKPFYFAGDTEHTPTVINGAMKIYAKWEDLGNTYQIVVNGGKGSHYAAAPGKRVAVIARVPDGKIFDRWESDEVVLEKPENRTTTFLMVDKSVVVTAVYENDPNYKDPDKDKENGSNNNSNNNSGGSGGSGGSSSGDSGGSDQKNDDKNNNSNGNNSNKTSAEDKIVSMDVPVKSGAGTITVSDAKVATAIEAALLEEAIDKAENKKNPQASVVLDVKPKKKANKITVKITKKAMNELAKSEVDVLEIQGTATTLKLDGNALQEITDKANGDVSFVIGKNTQKLTKTAKKVMGSRPAVNVKIRYKKKVNGKNTTKKITKLNQGKVEVQIPYKASKSEKKGGVEYLKAVYVNTSGKAYYVKNSKYDESSKTLVFKTNQLNTYGIAYKK